MQKKIKKYTRRLIQSLFFIKGATAEFAVALLLNLSRRIVEGIEAARNGEWSTWQIMWMCGRGLRNTTLGIYGLGNIGLEIAEKLNCFELKKIIYNDVHHKSSPKEHNYEFVEFNELLRQSDFIICCAAATEQTFEVFNKTAFNKMKNTAVFINISRGTLVNQDDLYDALDKKIIQAAGIINKIFFFLLFLFKKYIHI
jgi:glyoxylate/hydroxypyruvate reductase